MGYLGQPVVDGPCGALVHRLQGVADVSTDPVLGADDDDQAFLQALTRRLAANSPLREIACDFSPAPQDTRANIGAKRLDDILTSLMEGMAGTGAKHLSLGTRVTPGWVDIRLSSRERIDPGAFGQFRLNLYDRTLRWLGGRLEYTQQEGSAEFIIRLPALDST